MYTAAGFTYIPGWFGAEEVRSSDEKTSYLFGGFPDVMGTYKLIELNTSDAKYKVFNDVSVGASITQATGVLMSNGYLAGYNELSNTYIYTKGRIRISLLVDTEGEIINLRIRLHSANNEDIEF